MNELPQLEQLGDDLAVPEMPGLPDLRRLGGVPVEIRAEIGRTQMTVNEVLDLRNGAIVTLDRMAGEPVDLLVNGTLVASGEVVVIDEQFGVRITGVRGHDESQPQSPSPSTGVAEVDSAAPAK